MPVETIGPNGICHEYLLIKDNWATLQAGGFDTYQDVNGIFEISGNANLPNVYGNLFNRNNQAFLSNVVNEISINTSSAVIHCLFCRT